MERTKQENREDKAGRKSGQSSKRRGQSRKEEMTKQKGGEDKARRRRGQSRKKEMAKH